jgi:hypothetical protein
MFLDALQKSRAIQPSAHYAFARWILAQIMPPSVHPGKAFESDVQSRNTLSLTLIRDGMKWTYRFLPSHL